MGPWVMINAGWYYAVVDTLLRTAPKVADGAYAARDEALAISVA